MIPNWQYEDTLLLAGGIPSTEEAFKQLISVNGIYRYEFIDERVYDMTRSTSEHNAIVGNIEHLFRKQASHIGPCHTYSDQYILVPGKPPVEPDVVLTCDPADWEPDQRVEPFRVQSPLIVVEVLSPETEKYDRSEKFARYLRCPALQVSLLVSQSEPHAEVYQRANNWVQERVSAGQTIKLEPWNLELPLDEIYQGVFERAQ